VRSRKTRLCSRNMKQRTLSLWSASFIMNTSTCSRFWPTRTCGGAWRHGRRARAHTQAAAHGCCAQKWLGILSKGKGFHGAWGTCIRARAHNRLASPPRGRLQGARTAALVGEKVQTTWQHVRLPHSQLLFELSEAQQHRSARVHSTEQECGAAAQDRSRTALLAARTENDSSGSAVGRHSRADSS